VSESSEGIDLRAPWNIPETWAWTCMRDVSNVVGGGTPRTSDQRNFEGGDIPWITPADLSGYGNKLISHGARNITQKGLEESGARLMPTGTVLFSSRAPIGYVAIAANPVSTNQGFKSFILEEALIPDYVYYYLQCAKDIIISLASGTTFLEISGAKAALIPISLAPIPEQNRIVKEIERRFSQLDAGVAALERAKTNLKNYRASVLQAACEGRLVPNEAELARTEGREYEPADQLLTRILKERRATWETEQLAKMEAQGKAPKDDKWKAKYKEPAGPDTSELPELPEGWAWTISDSVFTFVTSGSRGWAKYYAEEGALFLRVGNLDHNSIKLDLRDIQKVHPPEGAEGTRTRVRAGDILISITAEIGMIAFVPEELGEAYINQHVALARPVETICKPYLAFYLVSDSGGQDQFLKLQRGAVKKGLGLDDIKAVALPLPPLSEQHRIVAEVEGRFSVLDKIEAAIAANLKRAERLRQAILKQAFEGKLVPQDPNGESAIVLLERIREERARKAEEEKANRKPARKKMAKTKRGPSGRRRPAEREPLVEVLNSAVEPLTPEQLFSLAGYETNDEEADAFYEELKREVVTKRIVQERPNDTEVYLRVVGE